jgi:hypothetical protein
MIDALTPLDYHIDVFVARLRAALYVMFHPTTRMYEETKTFVCHRDIETREVVRCVAVVKGSILHGNLRAVKIYYGKPQVPVELFNASL